MNASVIIANTEPLQTWGITKVDAASIMAMLIRHYNKAVALDDFPDFSDPTTTENYGELEEMCTVHSTTLLSESALQELSDVASDLESGIMNASDFSVQSKFTFSRLVKLQQTLAGGTLTAENFHRVKREAREAQSRAAAMELRYNQMKSECAQLKSENAELNSNTLGWYAQVEDLKPKLSELEQSCQMEKYAMSTKSEYLQTQLDASKAKCNGLRTRVDTLTAGHNRSKQQMMEDDAVLELQNAIQEAEGLYAQIEKLEQQVVAQDEKLNQQAETIARLNSEMAVHDVQNKQGQEELQLLRKKEDFASDGYKDAILELRNQQREIEMLQQRAHDLEFQILTMDAERAIVLPRLSQDEQVGLALLKNVSPLTTVDDFEKAESTATFVSRLATLAADHKQNLDNELQINVQKLAEVEAQLASLAVENGSLNKLIQELKIEAGTAKLGRNQFLSLSRDLKKQLNETSKEGEATAEYYLKEMKFFSDQYATVKTTDAALREHVDLTSVVTKASELEEKGGDWAGVLKEISYFSSIAGSDIN